MCPIFFLSDFFFCESDKDSCFYTVEYFWFYVRFNFNDSNQTFLSGETYSEDGVFSDNGGTEFRPIQLRIKPQLIILSKNEDTEGNEDPDSDYDVSS